MKHWRETASIFERIGVEARPSPCALATVVRITGSAYRRPGARFLVHHDGSTFGGVSGGCLEADVRENALQVIRLGVPRLLHYDTGSDGDAVFGLGLGCEGAVDVLVQPVDAPLREAVAPVVRELLAAGTPFALAAVVSGASAGRVALWARDHLEVRTADVALDRALEAEAPRLLGRGVSGLVEVGAGAAFCDALLPPPQLLVFGAGDDAQPLVRLALEVGFGVTVFDHRPAHLTPARFPPPAQLRLRRSEEGLGDLALDARHLAVVQTHSLEHDRGWLKALFAQRPGYIGLLGPRHRAEELVRELGEEERGAFFAPVGLDLGADGPEQVAVSIVAELLAVRAGRAPSHLRDRRGAIHGGAAAGRA